MIPCRHIQYEFIDDKYKKIQSEKVTFICLVGKQSAKIVDRFGKEKIVRRRSLIDVPDSILYPDIPIVNKEHTDWRDYTHFH